MSLLNFSEKTFLVFGVANRKSIAWFVGKTLEQSGAKTSSAVDVPSVAEPISTVEASSWKGISFSLEISGFVLSTIC